MARTAAPYVWIDAINLWTEFHVSVVAVSAIGTVHTILKRCPDWKGRIVVNATIDPKLPALERLSKSFRHHQAGKSVEKPGGLLLV